MTAAQGDLAALSRYVFRAPRWHTSVMFALVLAAVTGIGVFDSKFVLDDVYQGIFYIGVPTLVASFLTTPVDRWLGGKMTYNRSSLLALVCEVVIVVVLLVAGVVAILTSFGQRFVFHALIEGLAFIFSLRLLIVMAVSHRNPLRASLPASIQTLTAAVLLFVYSGTLRYFEIGGPITRAYLSRPEEAPEELLAVVPQDFVILIALCFLYSVAVWGLIVVVNYPWRRSLGVNAFDMLRGFIGHVAEGSRELEEVFEQIGEQAVVPVTVLSFKRPAGDEKARFVVPMVHPGPMGEIGGGNLPERIARATKGLAFAPHATASHDFNLVTEREVEKLLDAADRAFHRIEYAPTATASSRITVGEASVLAQAFDDDVLEIATFAPGFADDIDFAVGLSAMAETRASWVDDILLVDAHNSNNGFNDGNLGHVTPGSQRSVDLMAAARRAGEHLGTVSQGAMGLGVAHDSTNWTPQDGIGPLGIRVAVLRVDGHETAYILIDGNNMAPGLRDQIVERGMALVDEVEVMTTDTHVVNTMESVNQVGDHIDHDAIIDTVHRLVETARNDVEPVVAGMETERVEVTVFGNDRTETLASHTNAALSIGGALVGALLIALVSISIVIFFVASPT